MKENTKIDNKVMDIIAYYLSEYDMDAFTALGYDTQSMGFSEIAAAFGKKSSYLRRLRDEYHVLTSSHRRGQRNRPPRKRIREFCDYLSTFSFDELTQTVKSLFPLDQSNGNSLNKPPEMVSGYTEEQLEYIINFIDTDADLKTINTSINIRIYNPRIIKELKKLYKGKCQLCGNAPFKEYGVDITEVHHIDYFSRSMNNDSSNLIVLCPNHHRLIHKTDPEYLPEKKVFIFHDGYSETVKLDYHLIDISDD